MYTMILLFHIHISFKWTQVQVHSSIYRVVGLYRMVLQRLIQEQHLAITDSLLDNNNTVLKVIGSIKFDKDLIL